MRLVTKAERGKLKAMPGLRNGDQPIKSLKRYEKFHAESAWYFKKRSSKNKHPPKNITARGGRRKAIRYFRELGFLGNGFFARDA